MSISKRRKEKPGKRMGVFHLDKVLGSQMVAFEQKPERSGQKAAGYMVGEVVQEPESVKFQVLNGCMGQARWPVWPEQSEGQGVVLEASRKCGTGKAEHRSERPVPEKDLGFDSELREATVGTRSHCRVCRRARMIFI